MTSDGEVLDVFLASRTTPLDLMRALSPELPAGIQVLEVEEVGLRGPSLQSDLRAAEYEVSLPSSLTESHARDAIDSFLTAETVPWEQLRDGQTRHYDIRALVHHVWLEQSKNGATVVALRVRADSSGAGRPEQVVSAMGLPEPLAIHRRRLILADTSPAHEAWRRQGRFT